LRQERAALDQHRAENILVDFDDVRRPSVSSEQTLLADAIVAAGEARRNPAPPPLPSDPLARAITLSGARRRNEPISAADQQWFDAYLRRADHARR
jgi:hypothetical protein